MPLSRSRGIEVVALDADDTLWHSEIYFERTQRRFEDIVGRYMDRDVDVDANLMGVERRNLNRYGYGIKGFTLSMVEAAIEITAGAISAEEIGQLLAAGRAMLDHPVELIDGVAETMESLDRAGYRLVLVTKGDLNHQEHKIAASGLTPFFEQLEIVSDKNVETYARVIASLNVAPERFAMVGNSVRSDVLPVIEAGGIAAHIPYHVTWAHEHVDHDGSVPTLASIRDLPAWLADQ